MIGLFRRRGFLKQKKYKLPPTFVWPVYLGHEVLGSIKDNYPMDAFVTCKLTGTPLWETKLDQPCRFGCMVDQTCWLFGKDALFSSEDQGKSFKTLPITMEEHERIGAIAFHNNSFIVCLYRDHQYEERDITPRVLRITNSGLEIWSVSLPVVPIPFSEVRFDSTGNRQKSMKKFHRNPDTMLPSWCDPIVSSDSLTVITYEEMSSGIGCRYVLDLESGDLLWTSRPGSPGTITVLSKGSFLLGQQGYGAFQTQLFNEDKPTTEWPSHGICFETPSGKIMSVQLSNNMSVPQTLVELADNGSVIPHYESLPDYYTSEVVKMPDECFYFWRGGSLWKWSEDQKLAPINKAVGRLPSMTGKLQKIDDNRLGLFLSTLKAIKNDTIRVHEWIIYQI